ncbi:MAG: hypothetical protein R3B72_30810 [Polyangiaceae bacterium]
MVSRALFAASLSLALVACEDPPKPDATPTATVTATATAAPTSEAPAPPPPKPLDVAGLQKALKCGGAGHGPCEILADFQECEDWNPVTASGDGRWLGKAAVVSKGAFLDDVVLLRTRRVPLSEVGAGQLPAKIGLTNIPEDRVTERRQAEKAIRAYDRGDVPRPSNQVIDYIKSRSDWPEAFSMKAEANQIHVAVDGGMYLCQKSNQRLLVVKLSANRESPSDGIYAQLHPVSW